MLRTFLKSGRLQTARRPSFLGPYREPLGSRLNFGTSGDLIEVCIVDPRHSDADTAVRIQTPTSFLPDIAKGSFELGDADEPTNSYSFGKHAEFFKLKFVGKCQCQSGYVGLIASESMGGARAALDWEAFREGVDQETISFPNKDTGFLFAGPVVHSDSVSVFKFEEGGRVAGLLITSDAEELD